MNKVYAATDLHGCYEAWSKIKEKLDDTDILYYLGDAIDRGPRGLDIMLEMLKMPNVIYLKGNHEEFFQERAVTSFIGMYPDHLWTCSQNGGHFTLAQMRERWDSNNPIDEAYVERLAKKIAQLPIKAEYVNKQGKTIWLSHSGYFCSEDLDCPRDQEEYLWDRHHIIDKWLGDENTIIVHGHTPCPNLIYKLYDIQWFMAETTEEREKLKEECKKLLEDWKKEPQIIEYCDGYKICLDLGTFETGIAALYDLDEMTVEYVKGE